MTGSIDRPGNSAAPIRQQDTVLAFDPMRRIGVRFDAFFRECMSLTDVAALYINSAPARGFAEAGSRIRITGRLLDLAGLALIVRALRYGDIGRDEAKQKIKSMELAGRVAIVPALRTALACEELIAIGETADRLLVEAQWIERMIVGAPGETRGPAGSADAESGRATKETP